MKKSVFLEAVTEKQSRDELASLLDAAGKLKSSRLYIAVSTPDGCSAYAHIGSVNKSDFLEAVRILVLARERRLAELGIEEETE